MPTMDTRPNQNIISLTQQYVMNTYNRLPLTLVQGKGVYVWDDQGRKYLDFFSGLAVDNLGHAHPRVLMAIVKQARELLHVSNVFHIPNQARLAELLVKNSFADKVFFCNSGAEANEAAVKLARKYSKKKWGADKFEIITMKNSFHGRTLAMITATGQEKYQQGFEPLMPGFRYAEFGNIDSIASQITPNTCAVMIEPIQGEGGVRMAPPSFFQDLRKLCDEKGLLLLFDEVQTGIGRTGKLFAYQHLGIEPDIMMLAKGLASGVPIGAMLAKDEVANAFSPGDHASTFGGNPFSTAVALATIEVIVEESFFKSLEIKVKYLNKQLKGLKKKYPIIKEIRGLGFMIGIDLEVEAKPLVLKGIELGLLMNAVQEKTLRLLPPLILKKREIDEFIAIFDKLLEEAMSELKIEIPASQREKQGLLRG